MICLSDDIVNQVIKSYGVFIECTSHVSAEKSAHDVLDEEKVHEQIKILCASLKKDTSWLQGKSLLEIGSGYCIFLCVTRRDYGLKSVGIEPASPGFDTSFSLGQKIIQQYGFNPSIVTDATGEHLPWPDNSFDIVYSTNVLEHVQNPDQVIREALRVLKPGGTAQIIYPNYGSFFEGHYVLPWIPHMPHVLARLWLKLWHRDPAFSETLNFLTAGHARKWSRLPNIKIIDYGEDLFRERMLHSNFTAWAGLGLVKRWIALSNKLHLTHACASILLFFKAHTPIVFTFSKNG